MIASYVNELRSFRNLKFSAVVITTSYNSEILQNLCHLGDIISFGYQSDRVHSVLVFHRCITNITDIR